MKRVFLVIALFVLSFNSAFATNFNNLTNDSRINAALNMLEANGGQEVINNLSQMKVKVMFYDFSMMSMSGANYYAMKAKQGSQMYILINNKYKYSATEAVACLIAHESMHKLAAPTLQEEVKATTTEAKYWNSLKKDKEYGNDALITRLNNLSNLYLASEPGNDLIQNKIANSSFYKNQLAMN